MTCLYCHVPQAPGSAYQLQHRPGALDLAAQVRSANGQLPPIGQHLACSAIREQDLLHAAQMVCLHLIGGEGMGRMGRQAGCSHRDSNRTGTSEFAAFCSLEGACQTSFAAHAQKVALVQQWGGTRGPVPTCPEGKKNTSTPEGCVTCQLATSA